MPKKGVWTYFILTSVGTTERFVSAKLSRPLASISPLAHLGPIAPGELTEEEQEQVTELEQRDQEVRQHEAAHVAAGRPYVNGGAKLEHTRGPDGRMYATGGEVSIDVSKENAPEATVTKMGVVKRAAMAPANPSSQDRAVFSAASRIETEARTEIAENTRLEKTEETEETQEAEQDGSENGWKRKWMEAKMEQMPLLTSSLSNL